MLTEPLQNTDGEWERLHMHWVYSAARQPADRREAFADTFELDEFVQTIEDGFLRVVGETREADLWYTIEARATDGGYAPLLRVHGSRVYTDEIRYTLALANVRQQEIERDLIISDMIPDDASELDDGGSGAA